MAVICSTQFGFAMQENSGHFLVFMFDEPEHFKGKSPHLTFAIFKNSCLWVFITALNEK